MMKPNQRILSVNGGSSSIKFGLYETRGLPVQLLHGELENIGSGRGRLSYRRKGDRQENSLELAAASPEEAAEQLLDWLGQQEYVAPLAAIGHRIVHGMHHTEPELITEELLRELRHLSALDPEHLPGEIGLIEYFRQRYPHLPQVACFDTSFHASMPLLAKRVAIPRRYFDAGIQRYGFHGLSYAYLMEELGRVAGPEAAGERVILAHLGNGASLAAVKGGQPVDTTMGFSPTAGLPMGTRTGDLDPGVAWYLMQHAQLNADQFSHLVNHESGLLGLSETSADMRKLLEVEATDPRAHEAIEFFCYQARKWIGSFAAALGGIDTLVFSGGIGEHAPEVRRRISAGLEFLGVELDPEKNRNNGSVISPDLGRVTVRVIATREEWMIAKLVGELLHPPLPVP
ncbi:MAG: acetate/propionate family kinase [Lewinella sp.]